MSMRTVARTVFRLAANLEPRPSSILDPRHLARAGLLTARFGAEVVARFRRGEGASLAYAELDRKVRAFHLFETVLAALAPDAADLDPSAAVKRAEERLGQEEAVWASEGIGYELAERRLRMGRPTEGLLSSVDGLGPAGTFLVLNTGMGMAVAEEALAPLTAQKGPEEMRQALSVHVGTCSRAATQGYAALAFEPLGLVVRLLEPRIVPRVASALAALGENWTDFFWHGVGRGLYFLPVNLDPARSAPWAGLTMSREEPGDAGSRANAVAGFAWAVTLVNLRQPAIVESFLAHHASGLPGDPVTGGVVAALTFWRQTTGGSKDLRRFLAHVALPERRQIWERAVRAPFEAAVARGDGVATPEGTTSLFRHGKRSD